MRLDEAIRWAERGQKARQAGKPIDAVICFRRALQAAPQAAQVRYALGEILLDLGRIDEARAVWQAGAGSDHIHVPTLLALAGLARQTGPFEEAIEAYRKALSIAGDSVEATIGIALARVRQGDDDACADVERLIGNATPRFWGELASAIASARPAPGRASLLRKIAAAESSVLPPLILACAAEQMLASGETAAAHRLLDRAEAQAASIEDPEALRRFGLVAAGLGVASAWAERYARRCIALTAGGLPLHWPRRTAGAALRVACLVGPQKSLSIGSARIDSHAYLREVIAGLPRDHFAPTMWILAAEIPSDLGAGLPSDLAPIALGAVPDTGVARRLAETDADALIDLAGLSAATGPLLALRPARTAWTCAGLVGANVAPLITHTLPNPEGADREALIRHRLAVIQTLTEACATTPWFVDGSRRTAAEIGAAWRAAVAAHQGGDVDAALAGYADVLAEQPRYAPGHYLRGVLLRDAGQPKQAARALEAAIETAPSYLEARVALADLFRENQRLARAVEVCDQGLRETPNEPSLWRALGLARLRQRDAKAAHRAFKRALSLAPAHAMTHYNQGVALQMLRSDKSALRAYQRALALDPELPAAEFNIGIILREQGKADRAIETFERVLARDPRHVPAHKALVDALFDSRRFGDWFEAFDRFEVACPDALAMLVVALQACQYRGEFRRLDHYLDRLRRDEFTAESETQLADCLEELLFLLLYFDFDADAQLGLYRTYDAVAQRVYGAPLALPEQRKPGRIRVGYLSGDLRNHVMGKMMWSALSKHDRGRFELFFYSLSAASDEWTERYRGLSDHFEVIAGMSEQEAAARIVVDEIDILVDLSTHTRGSKPGILALKPARVQITHIAAAGPVGLSAIDFKLTDDYADLPDTQAFQIEAFLPMAGCVYPYRRIPAVADHPFSRERLQIAPGAVVVGAFVNPLKLSRRCLGLWREVLERIPQALLAISPMSPEHREIYRPLWAAAGIAESRVRVLPQGRDDAENQARYGIVDFALDSLPYGGVNGTLEALDMGVPVVTLVGRRHGERSTYSILMNLGVRETVASSGSEYVEICVRLATDAAFKAEVKAAIAAGLQHSALTDMEAHTRNLEQAYVRALEQRYPEALK